MTQNHGEGGVTQPSLWTREPDQPISVPAELDQPHPWTGKDKHIQFGSDGWKNLAAAKRFAVLFAQSRQSPTQLERTTSDNQALFALDEAIRGQLPTTAGDVSPAARRLFDQFDDALDTPDRIADLQAQIATLAAADEGR